MHALYRLWDTSPCARYICKECWDDHPSHNTFGWISNHSIFNAANWKYCVAHTMLPPELLTQVFLHVRPHHWTKKDLNLFVSISRVKRSWHVACQNSNLWNLVPCPTSYQTRKMLSRSADVPLVTRALRKGDEGVETPDELTDALANVELLFQEFHRMESIDIFGAIPGQLPYLCHLLNLRGQQPVPLLRRLVVAWDSGDDDRKDWEAFSPKHVDLHGAESTLTCVRLWAAPFPMLTASFPYLTDLEIKDLPWKSRIHVFDMLRALSRMPALTSLAVAEALTISRALARATDPAEAAPTCVTMPCLQHAYIDEDYEIAAPMYSSLSSPEVVDLEVPWKEDSDEVSRYEDMFRWQLVSDFFQIQFKSSSQPFPTCHIERLGPDDIIIRLYNPHNIQAPRFVAYLTGGRSEGQYQSMMAVGLRAAARYHVPCLELRHLEGDQAEYKIPSQFWLGGLSMANATLQELRIHSWKDAGLGLLDCLACHTVIHRSPAHQSSQLDPNPILANLRLLVITEPFHDWLNEQQVPANPQILHSFIAAFRQRKTRGADPPTIRFFNRDPSRIPPGYWTQLHQMFEGIAAIQVVDSVALAL